MSKLTQSSKGKTCIACGAPSAYSCHYNGPRQHDFGKGRSKKGHDIGTAEFCHDCDNVFSEGSYSPVNHPVHVAWISKWDRSEMFMYWIMMTNIRRFKDGDLKA